MLVNTLPARPSVPTGAGVRAWSGAITSTSFRVNSDVEQALGLARVKVSTTADMLNVVFTSAYQGPRPSTGQQRSYYTLAFDVTGLSANTTYYWKLDFLGAASQGDVVRSVKTPPSGAGAFALAIGSCCDLFPTGATPKRLSAPVFRSIALDTPIMFVSLGDTPYCDQTTADNWQRDLYREMRNCPDFDVMCQSVAAHWVLSDHDYMNNDCSLDTANSSNVFPITRTVYQEIKNYYPLALSGLLTQVCTLGLTRHIFLDCYGAASYVGLTCLGAAQLTWLQQQLTLAETDGMKWIFLHVARTWTGAVFNGFGDAFTAERITICNMIEACSVPVVLSGGDAHACAFDDGANTAFTTDGFGNFPQILASCFLQTPSAASGPYSWNGGANKYTAVTSMYVLVTMSADNLDWTAVLKGNPINASTFAPTTIATVATTDVTPAVSFNNAAPSVAHGVALTVNLDKTWFKACSVNWTATGSSPSPASGTATFLPNKKRTSFTVTFANAGSPTITLSGAVGCAISGTNPATVTVT